MSAEPLSFNRVLRSFREDLARPDYAAARAELRAFLARAAELVLPVRLDHARDWEICHVLLEFERLARGRGPLAVLDAGGGNAPLAYLLAERGHAVTVLDVDREALTALQRNARALRLDGRLRAAEGGEERWPFGDGAFDLVISISVIEGVLRSRRARFFAEARRVLAPGASLLLTFDYGEGARFVSDAPESAADVQRDLVRPSGLELVGRFEPPAWDPDLGPPVKQLVPDADGFDQRVAQYSFGALHLRKA